MSSSIKAFGLLLLASGFVMHMVAWPWATAMGFVLAATFFLILPGKVLLPVLFALPPVWFWGILGEGPIPLFALPALVMTVFGVLAARCGLYAEWVTLRREGIPFLSRRKLYRMCGLLFPLGFFPVWGLGGYRVCVSFFALAMLIVEVLRKRSRGFDRGFERFFSWVSKDSERGAVSGTAWYLWGVALASFFPGVSGPTAAVMMTLGDAWAVIAGKRWGRRRIFGKKTAEGTLACFAVALLSGCAFSNLNFPVPVSWPLFFLGAAATSIAELFTPGRLDNLTVAPVAAFVMWLSSSLF